MPPLLSVVTNQVATVTGVVRTLGPKPSATPTVLQLPTSTPVLSTSSKPSSGGLLSTLTHL
jgi:hypothetical protein